MDIENNDTTLGSSDGRKLMVHVEALETLFEANQDTGVHCWHIASRYLLWMSPGKDRTRECSRFFPGIAAAMAD